MCNAEIGEHRVPTTQQDVFRLDITMQNAQVVRIREGSRNLAYDLHGVVNRQPAFAIEPGTQRFALDARHDEEELAVGASRVEHRNDVRVLQPRAGVYFPRACRCGEYHARA